MIGENFDCDNTNGWIITENANLNQCIGKCRNIKAPIAAFHELDKKCKCCQRSDTAIPRAHGINMYHIKGMNILKLLSSYQI